MLRRLETVVPGAEQSGDNAELSEDPSDYCDFGYDIRTNAQAVAIASSQGSGTVRAQSGEV